MIAGPAWSPARSSLRRRCPRQYLLRYVLKAAPAQPDDHARMRGRVIHAGLAAALTAAAQGRAGGDRERLTMARYYPAAETAMRDTSDYSALSLTEAMRVGGEVYGVLASIPLPHPALILGVELEFGIEFEGERIMGITDYALRTGVVSLHIRDWKSGALAATPSADPALPFYGAVAAQKWPWAETITIGLYATSARRERVETLDSDQAQDALIRLAADARTERAVQAGLTPDTVDTLYPPTPGDHCRTCVFRSYCPTFRDVADLPVRPGVDVVAERERLVRALEQRSRPELPSVTESPALGGEA